VSRRLRVGVLSAGAWSVSTHIPELKRNPDVDLVVVTNQSLEAAEKIQSMFGFAQAFADWHQALELQLDAVIVSSPPIAHEEMVTAALNAGAHVLCEKPFALTGESATKMVETARKNDRRLLVGYGWPFTDIFVRTKELLTQGVIGDVEFATLAITCGIRDLLQGKNEQPWNPADIQSETSTYADPRIAGGGAIGTTLSHSLGLFVHLMDDSFDWVASSSFPEGDLLDYHESISGRMRNGASVNLYCVSTFGSAPHVTWRFEAYGPKGDLRVDLTTREIVFHGAVGDSWVEKFETAGVSYKPHMPTQYLLEAARGHVVSEACDSVIGEHVVKTTDSIIQSWKTGSRVKV
jgi:predicted dehydrogenase